MESINEYYKRVHESQECKFELRNGKHVDIHKEYMDGLQDCWFKLPEKPDEIEQIEKPIEPVKSYLKIYLKRPHFRFNKTLPSRVCSPVINPHLASRWPLALNLAVCRIYPHL